MIHMDKAKRFTTMALLIGNPRFGVVQILISNGLVSLQIVAT